MSSRYRISDVDVSRAGDNHFVVYSKTSHQVQTLNDEEMGMLWHCRPWTTIEQHAASWCREREIAPLRSISAEGGPRWATKALGWISKYAEKKRETLSVDPARVRAVADRLDQFAQRGFLVSADSFIEQTRLRTPAQTMAPIASIGITTRNRPGVLRRGLLSHAENRRKYGRATDYVIIDDAVDEASEKVTHDALENLKHETGERIRYASRADRRRYLEALIQESGAPPDLVQFALFGLPWCSITTGGARNTLLMATVGDGLVMVDDDSLCQVARCPLQEEGVSVSSRQDPSEIWAYHNREHTLRDSQFVDLDLMGLHETLLGRTVGECLPEDPAALDLETMLPAFESRLRNSGGHIRTTMAGVLGDSGIGSTAYLFVDAATQKRLTVTEQEYVAAVRSRQVLRCVRRSTITEGISCIAVNLGLDNRSLLAPFMPVQRNSDGIYARILRMAFRHSYIGYLPWGVMHDPETERSQELGDYWTKQGRVRVPEIIVHIMQAVTGLHDGMDAGLALKRLGEHFLAWGSLDRAEFETELLKRVWQDVGPLLSPKSDFPPPEKEFYARYREKYRQIVEPRILDKDYLQPSDLLHLGDSDEVSRLSREIVRRFGELLCGWTQIYEAAVRLRSRGTELAAPL